MKSFLKESENVILCPVWGQFFDFLKSVFLCNSGDNDNFYSMSSIILGLFVFNEYDENK